MARDATRTREKLIRSGERRFARDGVAGARLRDIVRDAGQGNDAAIGYHFGSRAGLLDAIVGKHMAIMEADRSRTRDDLDENDVAGLVRMVVLPTANLLKSAEGRDFLRIIEQLASFSGVRAGQPATVIRDTVLADQLARLESLLRRDLAPALARERVATLVTFLTATLAERARALEHRPRQPLGHQRYVDEIVAMLAAALAA
jgi:AcrR family transcriptional regulator